MDIKPSVKIHTALFFLNTACREVRTMPRIDVTQISFTKLYPLLVDKTEKKGRTREEVDQVTAWLTGYMPEDIVQLE